VCARVYIYIYIYGLDMNMPVHYQHESRGLMHYKVHAIIKPSCVHDCIIYIYRQIRM